VVSRRDERVVWIVPGTITDRHGNVQHAPLAADTISPDGDSRDRWPHRGAVRTENPRISGPPPVQGGPERGVGADSRLSPRPRAADRARFGPAENPLSLLWQLEQHRGSFQVLFYLAQEDSATVSRLRRRLRAGQVSIEGSLRSLLGLGLIARDSSPRFPFAKEYRLTQQGTALVRTALSSWNTILYS